MAWKKGQSGNPGGRPKVAASIRAQARVDSQKAYKRIVDALDDEKQGVAAAVQILKLAGISFASDAQETKDQAEAAKSTAPAEPTTDLETAAGGPELPLN